MRPYLLLFWALVFAGILLITAAYPEYGKHSSGRWYHAYDADGNLIFTSGYQTAAGILKKF